MLGHCLVHNVPFEKIDAAQLPQRMAKLTGHTDTVSSLDVCDERKQLFSGSTDGTIKVWSWENGNFACVPPRPTPGPGWLEPCWLVHALDVRPAPRRPRARRRCVNTVQAGGPVECILVFAPFLFAGTAATSSPGAAQRK